MRCPGLSRKGQFLFPGRWTVQLERGVTVLVLAVIPTNPSSWDVVSVCAFCCTAEQADFRSLLRFPESSVREIALTDKQGCEAGKTWMEGLYSGQCIYFQFPQRCQSCGPHQAKRELAYEDSRRSTRLPEITNLSTTAVTKESVTALPCSTTPQQTKVLQNRPSSRVFDGLGEGSVGKNPPIRILGQENPNKRAISVEIPL